MSTLQKRSTKSSNAEDNNIIDGGITAGDLFERKLIGLTLLRPSEVGNRFYDEYKKSAQAATDFYYRFSCDSNYIRSKRIKKTSSGRLIRITVHLILL